MEKRDVEIVLNMRRKGFDAAQIADMTGIALKKVEEIIRRHA